MLEYTDKTNTNMRLRDINKTLLISTLGLSSLVISAGYAIAEAPPSLELPADFMQDNAPPSLNLPGDLLCGNGTVDAGEVCDDGNTNNGDACLSGCNGCGTDYTLSGNQCTKNSSGNSVLTGNAVNVQVPLKFSKAEAFPAGFNPKMTDTKITYQVTQNAFIELKITDEANVNVVTLVNNEQVSANKPYSVSWNGTDKADGAGEIVKAGKYFFKISAKTSAQAISSDTKTGAINVIYASDENGNIVPLPPDDQNVSINNNPPKDTTGTGPETAVYLILPLIGYLVTSFRKR
jgi:cysteine-rich repeat protein